MFSGTKGYRTKPPVGVRLNPLHPLSQGLVGYWLFNEGAGSRASDISGKGNHGTLKNMSPNVQNSGWGGSKTGGGLNFDSNNDYVKIADSNSLDITGDISFVCSFNPTDVSASIHRIIHKNAAYTLYTDSAPTGHSLRMHNYDDGSSATSLEVLTANELQHIAVVKRGTSVNFYRNAIDITNDGIIGATLGSSAIPLYFGIDEDLSSYPYGGSLAYTNLYSRAISPVEVRQLYEDPFCNLLRVPVRYAPAAPGGLSIPVAMNYYRRRRVA